MELQAGSRLFAILGSTEVIVVKAPDAPVEVTCNGAEMAIEKAAAVDGGAVVTDAAQAILIGKRYVDEQTGAEFLCVKGGPGPLVVDGRVARHKTAKPLPSSD